MANGGRKVEKRANLGERLLDHRFRDDRVHICEHQEACGEISEFAPLSGSGRRGHTDVLGSFEQFLSRLRFSSPVEERRKVDNGYDTLYGQREGVSGASGGGEREG